MSVDIFGQSADMDALRSIADRYGLKIISDAAQAPGALYKGNYAGTLADIGGFSLNYHKHIHTGEGGILVTNDDTLAERLRLIRNHAEAVVGLKGETNLSNMLGYNFRLGEIECAIGIEQLKKLHRLVNTRQELAALFTKGLSDLPGIQTVALQPGCSHVYYVYPIILDTVSIGLPRSVIYRALQAEGVVGLSEGYVNVHMLPVYQKRIAYGSSGFPWSSDICKRYVSYEHGICPVAENLHENSFLGFAMCMHELNGFEVDLIVKAFHKVWRSLDSLRAAYGRKTT
jgi:dTDP-4-amino-4,6-dideoxygalactose transaminase